MTINDIEKLFLPTSLYVSKEDKDTELLSKYQKKMEKNEYIIVTFDQIDIEGNCYKVIGQITIIMHAEKEYSDFQRSDILTQAICVKIIEVDFKQKIIYVSNRQAREEQKPEIIKEINKRLIRNEEVKIMGRIVKIHKKIVKGEERDVGVWLDLCGVGILGYIPIKFWGDTYVTKLNHVAMGKVIATTVIGKKNKTKHAIFHYECMYQNECNHGEEIQRYYKNDLIEFECAECKKSLWMGKILGTNEVCYGNYAKKVPMISGLTYKGKVNAITIKGYKINVVQVQVNI